MPHGKLTAVVEGATDIKTPGMYGRGRSYCTLACGSQFFSSPTVEGDGSRPFFKTAFEFEIDRTTNELNVRVYSTGSTPRDDELVGYCTLNFKKVFFHGHTVPLTAYPIQQPSGNPGGKINISFKFKMRPSPNGQNAHAPMRCSPPVRVTHNIVGRQSLSLDWGYDCHEEDASEAKSYRRTQSEPPRHHENYLNLPGAASDKYQETKPHRHHENYDNLLGTASDNCQEAQPSFIRYGNPAKLRSQSPQTPNHVRPSPMIEYNQPIPGKPQYNQPIPGMPQYNQPVLGKPLYNQPVPGKPLYKQPVPVMPQHRVLIQPQVQMQAQQRPGLLFHLGNEALNGLTEGIGGELANQFMGGVGQVMVDAFCNF